MTVLNQVAFILEVLNQIVGQQMTKKGKEDPNIKSG